MGTNKLREDVVLEKNHVLRLKVNNKTDDVIHTYRWGHICE